MSQIATTAPAYDVAVNHATLALIDLERGGTGCSVQLQGAIDQRWAEAFARERRESRILSRFDLDAATGIITFVREAGSDPADVIEALEVLEALVERVSHRASATRP